ncbi:MAG TPA: M28 family peptidase [Cyclobacteriaceae bacterium]
MLTKTSTFRNHNNINQLNKTAGYIRSVFTLYSKNVSYQEFKVSGLTYKNIIASFGMENTQRIIIGAHYDVCGQQQGADDNATGITGLLELARMLKGEKLKYHVDLVAYSLEEPPYFRTQNMGSYVHAKSLADAKAQVYGMISLEMIGYFRDEKNSQSYPVETMASVYGTTGDFITLVKKDANAGKFTDTFCNAFKLTKTIKTEIFSGPPSLPGIDFSDHLNYWKFGFSAFMISDTAFYRNKNYHSSSDTIETLDLKRMGKVIDGIYKVLISF